MSKDKGEIQWSPKEPIPSMRDLRRKAKEKGVWIAQMTSPAGISIAVTDSWLSNHRHLSLAERKAMLDAALRALPKKGKVRA